MYGLVNKAVKDLVTSNFGQDKWDAIKAKAGVADDNFDALTPYDDAVTYGLVVAGSEILNLSPQEILKAFGKYWITFTAHEGYGELMDLFGSSFTECVTNLNQMHHRMGAMMPSLKPPKFIVKNTGAGELVIEYHSKRPGLAPMVHGLLEGLAEKHHAKISIAETPRSTPDSHDLFTVKILG